MSSPARAPVYPKSDSVPNQNFYRTRDEFVCAYQPVTPEEQILVLHIARAWMHLQDVYDLRSQVTAEKGLLGLFNEDFEKYKFLMRNLAEAERMWRHAVQEFHRARRRTGQPASTQPASVIPARPTEPVQASAASPVCDFPAAPLYNEKPRL